MKLTVHGATDVGRVREHNEDAFLIDEVHGFFAVADGLGGLPGGEVASTAAIGAVRRGIAHDTTSGHAPDLVRLVREAHEAVSAAGARFGPEGIGTTLTLAQVVGRELRIAHVGDSFALLVRGAECHPITREHNVENERRDILEASPYPPGHRFALTRVVGGPEPVRPELFREQLRPQDILILATDGLTDLVEFDEIAALAGRHAQPDALAGALISAALSRGGHDNITVVVITLEDD